MFSVEVLLNRLSDVVPVLLRSKQPALPAGVRWRSLSRIRMPKKQKVCQCLFLLHFRITVRFPIVVTADWCWSCRGCRSLSSGSGQKWSRYHNRAREARLQTQQRHRSEVTSILSRRTRLLLFYAVYYSFCLLQLFPQRRLKSPSLHLQWMEKPTWSSFASWLRFWSWRKATYIWTRFLWKYTHSPHFYSIWQLWCCSKMPPSILRLIR